MSHKVERRSSCFEQHLINSIIQKSSEILGSFKQELRILLKFLLRQQNTDPFVENKRAHEDSHELSINLIVILVFREFLDKERKR